MVPIIIYGCYLLCGDLKKERKKKQKQPRQNHCRLQEASGDEQRGRISAGSLIKWAFLLNSFLGCILDISAPGLTPRSLLSELTPPIPLPFHSDASRRNQILQLFLIAFAYCSWHTCCCCSCFPWVSKTPPLWLVWAGRRRRAGLLHAPRMEWSAERTDLFEHDMLWKC